MGGSSRPHITPERKNQTQPSYPNEESTMFCTLGQRTKIRHRWSKWRFDTGTLVSIRTCERCGRGQAR